jgi:hypothetical protein
MGRYFILVLLFLITVGDTFAWTGYTHQWICDNAGLSELNCANADDPKMQSQHPDINFKNHHCTQGAYDCSARLIADKYLKINTTEARGFAAHLYSDSMVPVHWYSTDYDTCHKIFEDGVEEKLKNSQNIRYDLFNSQFDFSSWNITMQCPAKFGKENRTVELYADNKYMDTVVRYISEQMHTAPDQKTVKEYDLTPILYVLIAFMIIILTLFILFGLKNRKNNSVKKKK